MTSKRFIQGVGALIAAGAVSLGTLAMVEDESAPSRMATTPPPNLALAPGEVQGICAVYMPPAPDPCDAVNGTVRFAALGALIRGPYHPKWVAANPGEVQRLSAFMAAPACSVAPVGLPQIMVTHYGAGLYALMQTVACARHPEPITWPPPAPALNPARTDKTPPTAPGPLTVTPSG